MENFACKGGASLLENRHKIEELEWTQSLSKSMSLRCITAIKENLKKYRKFLIPNSSPRKLIH